MTQDESMSAGWADSSPLRIGHPAPPFSVDGADVDHATTHHRLSNYLGKWLILVFYPRDFSFVCPTELTSFSARIDDFQERGCELLGISVDSVESHREWLQAAPEDGGLGRLQFPLASDPEGSMARAYSVWLEEKNVATRGLFIIDPDGMLQYAVVHNLSVGRGTDEVLRVLDALRTGGLCPSSWAKADGTIDVEGALQPGRVLGHYRIQHHLGTGTFGTVFSAWDLRLRRMAALKVLRKSEGRAGLMTEARAAAALNHPNVCTIYSVEVEDGLPLVAMEHLDGRPLSELIDHGLPVPVVRQLGKQIAGGVACAHDHGIVHGDLKPANIIVTSDHAAKILDFGLARSLRVSRARSEAERVTEPTDPRSFQPASNLESTIQLDTKSAFAIAGTPAYMSPEQANGQPSETPSDVFSLGLIMYEMLTGQRALAGTTFAELLAKLQGSNIAEEVADQVPEPFPALLRHMLARSPINRPSMLEIETFLA